MNYGEDPDGTPFHLSEEIDRGGRVSSYFQEFRAAGHAARMHWLLGANGEHEVTRDDPVAFNTDNSVSHVFQAVDPAAIADSTEYTSRLRASTFGVFGRVQYDFSDQLSVEGGGRFNRDERTFDNCAVATTDAFVRYWNLFRGGAQPVTQIGDCYVVDSALRTVDNVHSTLDQNSVSWRIGANWIARPELLLYANVSKGYKAGAVPVLAAATVSQFNLVPQESLLAYETGIKARMLGEELRFNAAAFYYDYRDKQLRGAELDPNFGPLQALVSIPRSHVLGAEAQVIAKPTHGLTLDASATYVHTNIDRFTGFDASANFGDHSGTPFPFSPTWQAIANIDYEVPLAAHLNGFVGASLTYNSKTYAGIGAIDLMRVDAYSLLDLRAGTAFGDGRYRVWFWGKNVADKYYWSNVFVAGDGASRFAGQPATYGVSASARL
jgi:iron complex outermembrane recepter protein